VSAAADALARILVSRLSGYSKAKIQTLAAQLASDEKSLELVNAALGSNAFSPTDKLLLQLRQTQLQADTTQTTQLITLARNVESPRILTHASAQKTTARSHRNSTGVGGLIGLILGGIAALLWEPIAARRKRSGGVSQPTA
jgi:uncharacterized protein involved in exopolysaccharide biosynthesis